VGASDEEVTLAADAGVVSIPCAEIKRSNLLDAAKPETRGPSANRRGS
jgi:hypothetical protein